jgi:hypothetical protein
MSDLQAWLKAKNRTFEQFGADVGCSGVHVGRIIKGDPRVSLALAFRVFDETSLAVGPLAGKSKKDIAAMRRAATLLGAA